MQILQVKFLNIQQRKQEKEHITKVLMQQLQKIERNTKTERGRSENKSIATQKFCCCYKIFRKLNSLTEQNLIFVRYIYSNKNCVLLTHQNLKGFWNKNDECAASILHSNKKYNLAIFHLKIYRKIRNLILPESILVLFVLIPLFFI